MSVESVTSAPSALPLPNIVLPSFEPMWNSTVLSPSDTSRFMTRLVPGGASAPCSAMSFCAASNHSSERNGYLSATDASWCVGAAGSYAEHAGRVEPGHNLEAVTTRLERIETHE